MLEPDTKPTPQTRYLAALKEYWLLVVAAVAAAVGSAAAYSFTAEPRYTASADIVVTPIMAGDETFLGINLLREGSQSRSVLTAARLIQTHEIATIVREHLNLPQNPAAVRRMVEVQPQQQSNILTVVASANSGEQAAAIANAFAEALIAERTDVFQEQLRAVIERLERSLAVIPARDRATSPQAIAISQRLGSLSALDGAADPTVTIASPAVAPRSPVWPRPAMSMAIAFLASLLVGSGLALALGVVNPRIRGEDALLLEHRLPILARIPRMQRRDIRKFLAGEPLPADVREAYRMLRASLSGAGGGGSFPRTILVTSALTLEGKTMTAVNLATTLAQAGVRVILLDGDLRRPTVGTYFGVPALQSTVSSLLLGNGEPAEALLPAPGYGDNLRLVVAHPEHGLLIDLLQVERVDRVLAALRLEADVIVIDSPPLTEVADALIFADAVEAVVVAVRLGRSERQKLLDLRRMLAQRGISPAGFVVTTRSRSRPGNPYGTAPPADLPLTAARERGPEPARSRTRPR